jgi:hypothetical protein
MDVDVTVSLGVVNEELVTARIETGWYGHGAAHPNLNFIQFNWMLKKQREMKPEDLFRPGSGWDAALQERCEKEVSRGLREGFGENADDMLKELPKALHDIVRTPRSWQLDAKGLTIPFEPYAVACYACTPPPVIIPWADLKPYIQPAFGIPK